jgi:hypothetical protein
MMTKKKIVDARSDSSGRTTSVRFEGNATFTKIEVAIQMAQRGQVAGAHVVTPKNGKPYLRTNPDGKVANNLDELSGDT